MIVSPVENILSNQNTRINKETARFRIEEYKPVTQYGEPNPRFQKIEQGP